MKAKARKLKKPILAEGSYIAKLVSIKGDPNDHDPVKVVCGFKVDGHDEEVTKEMPFALDEGTPLRKDTETILGRELTASQVKDGFELDVLLNKECQVVVAHKSGAGGKPKAVVSVIMAAPQASQVGA